MLSNTLLTLTAISAISSAALIPHKRADVCGAKGYDRGKGNFYYDDSGKENTYAICSAKCAANSKCLSFGYGTTECMLFSVALSGNLDADSDSSDIYYDRGCISQSTSASASAASTTKAITTSSSAAAASTTKAITTAPVASTTKATTTSAAAKTSTTSAQKVVTTSSTKTTSSTRAKSTSAATTTSAAPSCSPTMLMTSFSWFNSTHNLDCVVPNYPSDAQVCFNQTGVYPAGSPNTTCTPFCYTGLPSVAYQPLGYGPVDSISVGFEGDLGSYGTTSPKGFRDTELGQGYFDAGSAARIVSFSGNSNLAQGSSGTVSFNDNSGQLCGGTSGSYAGSFPLSCTHDAGFNATCVAASLPVVLYRQ